MAVVILTVFYANSQSFHLSWDGVTLGDTVVISPEDTTAAELIFEAIIHNDTDNGANIKVVRNRVVLLDGALDYFCWGACYPPDLDTSGMTMFVPAGGQSGDIDFSAHYEIHDVVGVSIVEYTFFNFDNPVDAIKVVVKYDTSPSAIDENILANISVSDIYPNPAVNTVSLDYNLPMEIESAGIKIVNLLGSVVKEQQINTGIDKIRMDISDLNDGIYFYSVLINGEAYITKKLIVK